MKKAFITLLALSLVVFCPSAYAQEVGVSQNYKIQSDSVNFAGDRSASGSYGLEDTAGELVSGESASASYFAGQGYQYMQLDIVRPDAPPTISAAALSSNEIEVSWGAAYDDFGIDRYKIYRDGLSIADVAAFPRDYVDSSLVPDHEYSYNVSAVDAAGNEGPLSATTTARTFASPIAGGSPAPTISGLSVVNWSITANDTSAIVSFHTSAVVKAEIQWGRDKVYADGDIAQSFGDTHTFLLTHLVPSTLYYVKIILRDGYDHITVYYLTFRTSAVSISGQPENVLSFNAVEAAPDIELSWQLPLDPRVVGVKILRRADFYPTSPSDGDVVFENKDASGVEHFTDRGVKLGSVYYYAIFTEDLAGNFSSGVLAEVGGPNALVSVAAAGIVDPKIAKLSVKDFLFIQKGNSLPVKDNLVSVVGNANLTVALRANHLPPVLKTVAVSMVTGDFKRFTFILRQNADGTRYEATVASLGDPAVYKLHFDILDFENHGLKSLAATLAVTVGEIKAILLDEKSRKFFGWGLLATAMVGVYVYATRRRYKALTVIKEEPWTVLADKLANEAKI
jgi:hypothetical protein